MSIIDREPRHLCAEDLQRDEMEDLRRIAAPRRLACAPMFAAGFFTALTIGMCIPSVAAAVLGLG